MAEYWITGGAGAVRSRVKMEKTGGVGDRFTSIGLTNIFFDFLQKAEPFDGILKGGRIRKSLDNLQDLLFHRFSGHDNHLVRSAL